jgi:transposase
MKHNELRNQYEQLKEQMAQLLKQKPQLGKNPELRQLLHGMQVLAEKYDETLTDAEAQIEQLKRELFGPKADRLTPEQEEQLNELNKDLQDEAQRPHAASEEILDEPETDKGKRKRRPVRHPMPENLETETVILEPEHKTCPCCGKGLQQIGEEVTEEFDMIPARLIRRRIVRPKYACCCGEAGVTLAALPPRLMPQSRLGLGLATHILLSRFDDHLSFYRLEQQFRERHQVIVPRQQMVQWTEQMAFWLRPIYDAMWQAIFAGGYLQVDETPVKVMDPEVQGKAARGFLWFYAIPRGDVILEFDRSRGLGPVKRRLQGFQGTIQTDAYDVYLSLGKNQQGLDRIGCLAHSRRRFYAALKENFPEAVWFIGQIRMLYKIEDEARELSATNRHALRQQKAPVIWAALKSRAAELQPTILPKSTMGKALSYFLDEYDALTGYLRDGRFEIDNNLVENAIRPAAVGRRRWLFIGHPDAGWRSAVIYSIIASCRRRSINPQDYLTDVLSRLPSMKIGDIKSLLPANWKPLPASSN